LKVGAENLLIYINQYDDNDNDDNDNDDIDSDNDNNNNDIIHTL